jgi:tRNA pseudouridine55 synthase
MIKDGILLVDKPKGWTSFDVVNKIRFQAARQRNLRPKSLKVGHAGTLDPFATGLLILLIGKEFTRRAEEFSKLDKVYEATMILGIMSSTGDSEGNLTSKSERQPTREEIQRAFLQFKGEITQTPHVFSAIKIDGRRAYDRAREGEVFEMPLRNIKVYSLELIDYDYPAVYFRTHVSSGTYIRTLVEDIGKKLSTSAYCKELRRTHIGNFSIDNAGSISSQ